MATTNRVVVHLFRDAHFAPAGDTVVCVAPLDVAVSVFGAGERPTDGLSKVFGGCVLFRNDDTGERYAGVWGARKTAKFREALRGAGMAVEILEAPPAARLAWYEAK